MTTLQNGYRQILFDEFRRRQKKNTSYSLRAYSRDLEVPVSRLSLILNGKSGISRERAQSIGTKLKLSPVEVEFFVASAEAEHSRSPRGRLAAREALGCLFDKTFTQLNLARFAVVRDWYHVVLLELTALSKKLPSLSNVSRALGVREEELREGLSRLHDVGLLEVEGEEWRRTHTDLATPNDIASRAIRDFHRQVLAKAEESLETHSVEEREFGTMVLSMNKEIMPEMKELIRRFRKEAAALSERNPDKESVYFLSVQLFPVIRKDEL